MPDDTDVPNPADEGGAAPEPTAASEADAARRTLDEVTVQLEWVQARLDELDAAAAAAATALEEG